MGKKHPYRCAICHCYLDPGEGRICSDCLETIQRAEERKQAMRDNDVIPVSVRVPESIVEVGVCPFCGQGYEFQTIGQATDELLEKWAVQKCGCIDARLERMAEEERRKEERRRR